MATYKVNVSLPEDLVSHIDEAAEELGLSRSGFIAEASTRYIADVKNLSAEERRRKDIERAIATFRRIGAKLNPDYDFLEHRRPQRNPSTPEEER